MPQIISLHQYARKRRTQHNSALPSPMNETAQPTLDTERLILRPFVLTDASEVQRLAGEREIAATSLRIPHPYKDGLAESWIRSHPQAFKEGKGIHFAIVAQNTQQLCGAVGLGLDIANINAELDYWIGKPFWGQGYCTEAAKATIRYGFATLKLHRIYANHFSKNPASGRVMQKLGMMHEGCLRQHTWKWGNFEDVELYGLLKTEWQSMRFSERASATRTFSG